MSTRGFVLLALVLGLNLTGCGGDGATTGGEALSCDDLPLCDGFETSAAGGAPDPALWTVTKPHPASHNRRATSICLPSVEGRNTLWPILIRLVS